MAHAKNCQSIDRGLLRRDQWPYPLPFGREARLRIQQQLPTTDGSRAMPGTLMKLIYVSWPNPVGEAPNGETHCRLPQRAGTSGVPQGGRHESDDLQSHIRVDEHVSQVWGTPQRPTFGANFAAARVSAAMSRKGGGLSRPSRCFT
jgi:hypothetical protein